MKRLYISLVILLITAAVCITEVMLITKTSEKFKPCIDEIQKLVYEEDYEKAYIMSISVYEEWDDCSKILDCFLLHDATDSIGNDMYVLPSYIRNKDITEIDASCERIIVQLKSLDKNEIPVLDNLL